MGEGTGSDSGGAKWLWLPEEGGQGEVRPRRSRDKAPILRKTQQPGLQGIQSAAASIARLSSNLANATCATDGFSQTPHSQRIAAAHQRLRSARQRLDRK